MEEDVGKKKLKVYTGKKARKKTQRRIVFLLDENKYEGKSLLNILLRRSQPQATLSNRDYRKKLGYSIQCCFTIYTQIYIFI